MNWTELLGAAILGLLFLVLINLMFTSPLLAAFKDSAKAVAKCDNGQSQNEFDSTLSNKWDNREWGAIIIMYDAYKKCFNVKSSSIAFYAFENAVSHCSAYPALSEKCQTIKGDLE